MGKLYQASRDAKDDIKRFETLDDALKYIEGAEVTDNRPYVLNLGDLDFTTMFLVWGAHREHERIRACHIHDKVLKKAKEKQMQETAQKNRKRAKNDRFGEDVLAANSELYNGIRVCGVREEVEDGNGRMAVVVDNESPQFFSVYAVCKDGTEECVGDFATLILALAYADDLHARHGWPIHLAKWYGWPILAAA